MLRDRSRRALVTTVCVAALTVGAAGIEAAGATSAPDSSVPASSDIGVSAPTASDNDFLPDDANIGDCISAVERPGCGSKARGGWRQSLTFVAIMTGLALIGTRIFLSVKKRDNAVNHDSEA